MSRVAAAAKTKTSLGAPFLLALCLLLAPLHSALAQAGPAVRIAVEGAFPPFNYIDQSNELQGFEVDLAKALCETMGARCTLVQHAWDGIVRGLVNREYDAIMSSLAITERRQKRIAFSRRYYLMPSAFLAPKAAAVTRVTPEALAGKRIGTVDRSEHAAYLEASYKESEVRLYGKLEEAILDLQTERIDLVLGDKLQLTRFLEGQQGECCLLVADAPFAPAYQPRAVGVGLRKEDEELKARFDAAIASVMANGTYDRIRAKYFPFDIK